MPFCKKVKEGKFLKFVPILQCSLILQLLTSILCAPTRFFSLTNFFKAMFGLTEKSREISADLGKQMVELLQSEIFHLESFLSNQRLYVNTTFFEVWPFFLGLEKDCYH